MPVQEQLNIIFQLLQAGRSIPIEEVIEIVPDVAGTGLATQGTSELAILGNGTATEVTSLVVDSTATEVSTAGVGLLAMDVGAVGLAIAPALGIIAGVGLYSLAPEFWTNVSNVLLNAGETIGGKVRAFINGETKTVGFSEQTIEIFKQAFIEAGLFDGDVIIENAPIPITSSYYEPILENALPIGLTNYNNKMYVNSNGDYYEIVYNANVRLAYFQCLSSPTAPSPDYQLEIAVSPLPDQQVTYKNQYGSWNISLSNTYTYNGLTVYWNSMQISFSQQWELITDAVVNTINSYLDGTLRNCIAWMIMFGEYVNTAPVQEGAILPDTNPFPQTYPSWTPWTLPDEITKIYPIEIPAIKPDPDQQQAQSPQEIPDNDPDALEWLIETLPQPDPNPDPYPEPSVNPDPDPAPEPEPISDPEPEPTPENPVDPNPTPSPSPLPIVPDMPDTVESNAMFTVYKPSMSQVNAFGGWLWSSNIVEQIKRIWQNPLDGIISFMKVYVDAPTSGNDTIKVGILDSEVSAPIVSGQFVTVECGGLNVSEKFYNATDYSPFVAMHLYLPFIGIVELDIDEFMSGEIKVTYHVDVYTGTCLAEVKSRRSPDMPDWTIVYTFSGNASQQLPLTSAEFSGALSSLVGVVGGGLAIASGGGLGLLAGATGIAHAVTHEMVHLAHSGSLSANAGIMGARKPYLILTRRHGYDANGYNELYGYPSNKTVYLNNCSGYVKVKDIRLETVATDSERMEIENLLKAGVII